MESTKHFCFPRSPEIDGSRREELFDENGSVIRILLREKVAALHRLSLRPRSPLPPNAERTTVFCIERVEWTALSPQMQHRTFNSLGRFLVRTIVFDIDRCRGSIFLADSVNAGGITIGGNVFLKNLAAEGTVSERIIEDGLGRAEQIAFRERGLLREQNPGPVGLCEACIGPVPRFENRNHIEDSETLHVLRMVQSQPVGNPSTAIVADQGERRKAEFVHHAN